MRLIVSLALMVWLWSVGITNAVAETSALREGQVVVKVEDRSREALQQGWEEGLDTMVLYLAGRLDGDVRRAMPRLREHLPSLVQRHHYTEGDQLVLHFDVQGIKRRLQSEGVMVWPSPAPRILIWAVEQGPGRGIPIHGSHDLTSVIEQQVSARGMRPVIARWDDQDMRVIHPADIRGRFDEPVLRASQGYDADVVVTVTVTPTAPFASRWRVLEGRQEHANELSSAASQEQLMAAVFRGVSHVMVGQVGVLESESRGAQATVSMPSETRGMTETRRMAETRRFQPRDDDRQGFAPLRGRGVLLAVNELPSFAPLKVLMADLSKQGQARLAELSPDRIVLDVQLSGGQRALEQWLSEHEHMQPCDASPRSPLEYCWRP